MYLINVQQEVQFCSIFSNENYIYKRHIFGNMYFSQWNKFAYSYHIICKNAFVQQIKIEIT